MTTVNAIMNQIEKLVSASYLIKKAEMDVGNTALAGGGIGALLLGLLGRRIGVVSKSYSPRNLISLNILGNPFIKAKTDLQARNALIGTLLGAKTGAKAGLAGGGLLAALSNSLNSKND